MHPIPGEGPAAFLAQIETAQQTELGSLLMKGEYVDAVADNKSTSMISGMPYPVEVTYATMTRDYPPIAPVTVDPSGTTPALISNRSGREKCYGDREDSSIYA
jgi:hypothetical protein